MLAHVVPAVAITVKYCRTFHFLPRRSAEDELMATADERDALAEQLESANKHALPAAADNVRSFLCLVMLAWLAMRTVGFTSQAT